MKKMIVALVLVLSVTQTFGQETEVKKPVTRQELLQESKKNFQSGCVLLGLGGGAIALVAPGRSDMGITAVVALCGGALIICSIPTFIRAANQKKKALKMTAGLDFQKLQGPSIPGLTNKMIPGLTLKIRL